MKIWGESTICSTKESWIKLCLHYFTLHRTDITIKSDFQKELLLLNALNKYLQNFQLFVLTCVLRPDVLYQEKKKPTVKIYMCMFCLDISYLANGSSSPSVKSIMLTMQYLKGTLYCNSPLSPSLLMYFSSCRNSIWPEHLRKTAKTENNFPF